MYFNALSIALLIPGRVFCPPRRRSSISDKFQCAGHDIAYSPFGSVRGDILSVPKPSPDMDEGAFLQPIERDDMLSLPGYDMMPGSFDDDVAALRLKRAVGGNGEVGNFGVSEVLYVNTPDDASDFYFVQLFQNNA